VICICCGEPHGAIRAHMQGAHPKTWEDIRRGSAIGSRRKRVVTISVWDDEGDEESLEPDTYEPVDEYFARVFGWSS